MEPNQYPPVCTPDQAAEILQINQNMMYELCRRPGFPAMRLGRIWRINTAAMLEWVTNEANRQHEEEHQKVMRLYQQSRTG